MKRKGQIAVLLTALALFTACSGGNSSSSGSGSAASTSGASQASSASSASSPQSSYEPGKLPICEQKEELSIMISAKTADVEKNWAVQYMEDLTNVHINWKQVPGEQYREKLNLLVASGEAIDIVTCSLQLPEISNLANQGLFIPVNDLVEDYSVHYKQKLEQYPELRSALTQPDGKMYGLGQAAQTFHAKSWQKFWINNTWIEALGMEVPATPEDLRLVLKAFKEQDPNGNGKADELPLVGISDMNGTNALDSFLMCPFQFCDTESNRLYVDNGKVTASYMQPGYQEGVRYLRQLYKDGLIAPQTFTQDAKARTALNEGSDSAVIGSSPATHVGAFGSTSSSTRWQQYIALPPLKGADGVAKAPDLTYQRMEQATFITSKCQNPELAMLWLDQLVNDSEVGFSLVWGKQGTAWDWAKEGELGTDGEQARITIFSLPADDPYNQEYQNNTQLPILHPNINAYYHSNRAQPQDIFAEDGSGYERFLYLQTLPYMEARVPLSQMLPNLYYPQENVSEVANLQVALQDSVTQALARFITGDLDIEKDWGSFQKELEDIGVSRYLELAQQAYDVWKSNQS